MNQTNSSILVIEYDESTNIASLLDLACSEQYAAGKKSDNYWILDTSSKFVHDGQENVNIFNNIMFQAGNAGYKYIQITFKTNQNG